MSKNYIFILLLNILITSLFSRSMEFTSCKTYVKVEKNLEKGAEFGLLALEVEPNNSYIPFFIGQYIYRKQKKTSKDTLWSTPCQNTLFTRRPCSWTWRPKRILTISLTICFTMSFNTNLWRAEIHLFIFKSQRRRYGSCWLF